MDVTKQSRSEQKSQRPRLIWFTGLSGSGKSSIANILEKKLQAMGRHTITLDGDNIRHGLNRDLGFTQADRVENIRRVGETSKLMVEAGLICISSFISPFASERGMVRNLMSEGEFIEVFVDTPLEVCEKGMSKDCTPRREQESYLISQESLVRMNLHKTPKSESIQLKQQPRMLLSKSSIT